MSSYNKPDLKAKVNSIIKANGIESITGALLNEVITDIIDSSPNKTTDISMIGLREYNSANLYDVGSTMMLGGILYECIAPTTGAYDSSKWFASTESISNKASNLSSNDNFHYPTTAAVNTANTLLQNNINAEATARINADNLKVDKITGKGLSTEDYTTFDKGKLASISEHFVGRYISLASLQTAHPTGLDGQYGVVDVDSSTSKIYVWDSISSTWTLASGLAPVTSVNSQTGAVVLNTDNVGEGSTNKYWTNIRTISSLLTGYAISVTNRAIAAADSVLIALGVLEKRINDNSDSLLLKAPLLSPVFTGTPTVPTAAPGTNNLQAANTAFVNATIATSFSGGGGVYYVSKVGNDATGQKGNASKHWLTIDAAVAAANSLNSAMVIKWIQNTVSVVINGLTYSGTDAASLATAIGAGPTLVATVSGNYVTVTTTAASFIADSALCTGGITITSRTIVETATIVVYGGDYTVTNNLYKDGVNFASIGVVNITMNMAGMHLIDIDFRSCIGIVMTGSFNLYAKGLTAYAFNYNVRSPAYANIITVRMDILSFNSTQGVAIYIASDLYIASNFDFTYLRAVASGDNAVYSTFVTNKQNIFIKCLVSLSTTHDSVDISGVIYDGMCISYVSTKYALICRSYCKFTGTLFASQNDLLISGIGNQIEQVGTQIHAIITGDGNTIESTFYRIDNTGKGNEFNAMGDCVELHNSGDMILRNFRGSNTSFWIIGYSSLTNTGGNLLIKDFICDGVKGMWTSFQAGTITIDTDLDIIQLGINLSGGTLIVNKRLRALFTSNNDFGNADLIIWTGGNLILRQGAVLIKNHVDANVISSDANRNIKVYTCFANQDFRNQVAQKNNCIISGTVVAGEVYTDIINSVSYSYTAIAGDTPTNVVVGLIAAIAAAPVTKVNNGANYDIIANVPGVPFSRSVSKTSGSGTIQNILKRNNNSTVTSIINGSTISIDSSNLI